MVWGSNFIFFYFVLFEHAFDYWVRRLDEFIVVFLNFNMLRAILFNFKELFQVVFVPFCAIEFIKDLIAIVFF